MQRFLTRVLYAFFFVFIVTALLPLVGIGYTWFLIFSGKPAPELPYLNYLFTAIIIEIIAFIIAYGRKGIKYLPSTEINKTAEDTCAFMERFLQTGSTATIVSNRVAWLSKSEKLRKCIADSARDGTSYEIITPNSIPSDIRNPLEQAGVKFYVTNDDVPPDARFTLLNANRGSAEKLAIARGMHPEHEILVFDNNSGPQIISLAKDIIRKSKDKANAQLLGQSSSN